MRPTRLIAVVLAAAVAMFALQASAHHSFIADPNDVRGLMDVRRVETRGLERPRWKVVTFSEWSVAEIFDFGFVLVRLDTFSSPRFDYFILVRSDGIRLKGSLWKDRRSKRDYKIGSVRAWRGGERSLSARLPLERVKVGARRLNFRWSVETIFTSGNCPRACFDLVPNDGAVAEPLPLSTPTVSPTPTITPSPSPSP